MLPEQDLFIENLYREYAKKLFLYAFIQVQDQSRAQDIVQDTFHTAVRRIDTVMNHENPGGWLMDVLKKKISESERSHRRYVLRFASLNTDVGIVAGDSQDPVNLIEDTEADIIQKIKSVLSEDEYNFLKRVIFDKVSHLDMAKELGITVYASQKRLERIRKKLYDKAFPERKKKKK